MRQCCIDKNDNTRIECSDLLCSELEFEIESHRKPVFGSSDEPFKHEMDFPIRIYMLRCNSIIKFLGNLFKFKAGKIFNRRNIQYILRIKNFSQRRSWAN